MIDKYRIWSKWCLVGFGVLIFVISTRSIGYSEEREEIVVKKGELGKGGVEFHLIEKSFDPKKHKVERCVAGPKSDPWKGVCIIDDQIPFGNDYEMPKSYTAEAFLLTGKKKIPLQVTGMFNPWGGYVTIEGEGNSWTIQGIFSDGAGAYFVQWSVREGRSIRTIITDNDSIWALYPETTKPKQKRDKQPSKSE